MKDQYVGDIGDYGKYSLLRALLDAGIKVGINWYHTKPDDSNDGKYKDYLNKDELKAYSPEIFTALENIVKKGDGSIKAIEKSRILSGAQFFSEYLCPVGNPTERTRQRELWFGDSIRALSESDLLFLDPDNGLLVGDNSAKKGAEKYVLPKEVFEYCSMKRNVVYYCHKGRRTDEQWQRYLRTMPEMLPCMKTIVLTYHKGTQRSYVFLIHKREYIKYRAILDDFLTRWDGLFTDEGFENRAHS